MFTGHRSERLNPLRALSHPAWWGALLLLAANDHALKGSGTLPGLITGKLSDFAGLFVAPALFACVVRARSRLSVVASHAVVAFVFVLLELCHFAADIWQRLFATLGASWCTWADPTDLVALPMVLVSYSVLTPAMQRAPEPSIRRSELAGLALGLVFCTATAPHRMRKAEAPGLPNQILVDVFVHIPVNEREVAVYVQQSEIVYDCERLLKTPSQVLDVADFFVLPHSGVVFAGENQALWQPPHLEGVGHGCAALLIRASQSTWFNIGSDKLPPTFVVWDTSKIPVRPILAHQTDESSLPDGAVIIREAEDRLRLSVRGPMLMVPADSARK